VSERAKLEERRERAAVEVCHEPSGDAARDTQQHRHDLHHDAPPLSLDRPSMMDFYHENI
jgi:hypothetical protein